MARKIDQMNDEEGRDYLRESLNTVRYEYETLEAYRQALTTTLR